MSLRRFGMLAAVTFVAADIGTGVAARLAIAGEPLGAALGDHLGELAGNPVGSAMLFAPFALLALICAPVADKAGRLQGLLLFTAGAVALTWLFWLGYSGAQSALLAHRWTAAALSVGFLPFVSLPVLLLALIAGAWLTSRRGRPK